MCGIAGFTPGPDKETSVQVLKRMLSRIRHRGPDQSGVYVSQYAGLGSVRLSIIDIKTGGMPLSNEDGSLWIVFNGEIFNYVELREKLKRRNHRFRTASDTEVILHMYEEFGPEFLSQLNGQFAIAIWDRNRKELFLARDRVGIRPLFYSRTGDGFVFASEIKALLEFPGISCRISPRVLSQVFTLWTPISPGTIFEDIYELSPGSYMRIGDGGIVQKTYWELPVCRPEERSPDDFGEALDQFHELFEDSVRIRLRADVPVGAYLSGGIDSSVTTSYIRRIAPENLRTFSIGFYDQEFDESRYQQLAVDHFRTDHTFLNCRAEDIARDFPSVVWHAETPLLRTAPGPMRLLSDKVRDSKFKVVITGEGADELLGGYDIFKEAIIRQFWAKDPQSKIRPALLKKLYPFLPQMNQANLPALKFFYSYRLTETDSPVYSHLLRWNNTSRIRNYFSGDLQSQVNGYDPVTEVAESVAGKLQGADLLTRAQWLEISLFMSGYLLSSQGDRMAMANSVEGRYPFLDYRVIEFCMKLPARFKLNGLNEKVLLKKLMEDKLPGEIIRRPKQSYRAPILESFFAGHAPGYIREFLDPAAVADTGYFNPVKVEQLVSRMRCGKPVSEVDHMAVTGVLSTQLLHHFFTRRSFPPVNGEDLANCTVTIQ